MANLRKSSTLHLERSDSDNSRPDSYRELSGRNPMKRSESGNCITALKNHHTICLISVACINCRSG